MVLVSEMVLISAMSADSCKLLSLVIRMGHNIRKWDYIFTMRCGTVNHVNTEKYFLG